MLKAAAARSLGQLPPDYFFLSPEFPSPRRGVRGEAFYHSLSQTLTSETELPFTMASPVASSLKNVALSGVSEPAMGCVCIKFTTTIFGFIYVFFII